jgi:hypothetical protein
MDGRRVESVHVIDMRESDEDDDKKDDDEKDD